MVLPFNTHLIIAFYFVAILLGCRNETQEQPYTSSLALELLKKAQKDIDFGNYRRAMALVDSAGLYDRGSPDIHFVRGLLFEHLNKLNEARNNYRTVYKLQPNYPGIRFYLGNVQFKFESYRDAVKLYWEALDHYRADRDGFPKSRAYLNLGFAYSKMGKQDSALSVYRQAIKDDNANAEAYFRIAKSYKDAGDLDRSLEYLLHACRFDTANPEYQFELGDLYFRNGEMEKARYHLTNTIEKMPWHYRAYYQLGQILLRTGQEKEAESYLARSDTLKNRFANIVRLEQKTQLEPANAMHWSNLGKAYAEIGDYETAKRALATASSLDPGSLALQNDVAYICIYLNQYGESISHFRDILSQDSTFAKAWLNLGLAYARTGRMDEARDAWEKALSLQPGNAQAREFLAKIK
jgi:tetratricopeptide (TPR) repeat protein